MRDTNTSPWRWAAGGIALGAAAAYVALRKPKKPDPALANPTLGDHGMIYMDYNATTPIDPRVAEAMQPFLREGFGNPSSSHPLGKLAKAGVTRARAQVASLVGAASPDEIVFMSCGTESINATLTGAMRAARDGAAPGWPSHVKSKKLHLITSRVEHVAVLETCRALEAEGFQVTYLPVDAHGRVSAEQVAAALTPQTVMVSVMLANNETGTLHPVREIATAVRAREAQLGRGSNGALPPVLLHTDASQALGKVPVAVDELGVDYLTVAGHKLYAPKGIGALYIRKHKVALGGGAVVRILPPPPPLAKLMHGAGHEGGHRAGTENVLLDVALGQACALAEAELAANACHMLALRNDLEAKLRERLSGGGNGTASGEGVLRVNGHPQERLPNTLNISIRGVKASCVLARMQHRVAASAASACHSEDSASNGKVKGKGKGEAKGAAESVYVSYVLTAMGVPVEWGAGTLRLTVGRFSTSAEVAEVAEIVGDAVEAELAKGTGQLVTGGKGYQPPWAAAQAS